MMTPAVSARCAERLIFTAHPRVPIHPLFRAYASQSGVGAGSPSRKQVTIANDDGRVTWANLSIREKAARTTQQTFNLGVVLAGVIMTGGVAYFLYKEVFSTDSEVSHFNRAVDEIKASPRARELLGPASKITAFGEPARSRWARKKPVRSSVRRDRNGREHLMMRFNVQGPKTSGVVNVHMVRQSPSSKYEYDTLSLDVPGNKTIYLRKAESAPTGKGPGFKFLGVNWR